MVQHSQLLQNSLVVVRFSGGVSIISIDKNKNLLGESSEFFAGAPTISTCLDGGFYVLVSLTSLAWNLLECLLLWIL